MNKNENYLLFDKHLLIRKDMDIFLNEANCFFYFHLIGEVNRSFSPPDYQCWSDETAIVFDVFERLIGYKYFGIIDHDEFLIPARNRSLKQFMVRGYPTQASLNKL